MGGGNGTHSHLKVMHNIIILLAAIISFLLAVRDWAYEKVPTSTIVVITFIFLLIAYILLNLGIINDIFILLFNVDPRPEERLFDI